MIETRKPTLLFAVTLAVVMYSPGHCLGQSAKEPAGPNRVTGAITGRVLNSAGEPLPDARVYAGGFANTQLSRSGRVSSDGTFKIDGLDAGQYRVWSSVPGYVPAFQPTSVDTFTLYRAGDVVTLTMVKGGVITGTVTGSNGPVIAVGVYALRVRDENGKRLRLVGIFRERWTDDRGMYRIYGLPPGGYIVRVARPRSGLVAPSAYDADTPTYFPSSTRNSAVEIAVREGDEITADIQYRGETGQAITGMVSGMADSEQQYRASATVALTDVQTGTEVAGVPTGAYDSFAFAFSGVPDGEYELTAYQFVAGGESLRSPPRRLSIRGNGVANVVLALAPLASIAGRLVFESDPKAGCGQRREHAAEETIVFARRYEPEKKKELAALPPEVSLGAMYAVSFAVGDANGGFILRNLPPGSHRIEARAPADGWYLRSIATPQAPHGPSTTALAVSQGINVRSSEKVSGVIVTFTEGAAVVRGQVAAAAGQNLAATRVYLVPAEKDNAPNLLRYFEAPVPGDGSFAIGNIAPGDYLIIALKSDLDSPPGTSIRFDINLRNAVTRDAAKSKQIVTLKPCEKVDKYELPLSVPTKP